VEVDCIGDSSKDMGNENKKRKKQC